MVRFSTQSIRCHSLQRLRYFICFRLQQRRRGIGGACTRTKVVGRVYIADVALLDHNISFHHEITLHVDFDLIYYSAIELAASYIISTSLSVELIFQNQFRVSKALIENSKTLRLPIHIHERLSAIRHAKAKLEEKGITPSIEKIAESLNISTKKVLNATEARCKVFSIDRPSSPSLNGLPGDTFHIPNLIGGSFVNSQSSDFIDVINPATQEVVSQIPLTKNEEFKAAVSAAKQAFPSWRNTPVTTHQRVMLKLQQLIRRDMVVEHACGMASLQMGEFSSKVSHGIDTYSIREPLGVCAGICPFNFPAMIPLWMFPVAVTSGNTFVLKPSEKDPAIICLRMAFSRLTSQTGRKSVKDPENEKLNETIKEILKEKEEEKERLNGIITELEAEKEKHKA
ncbi:hypothetical protein R6Q59_033565 [Mikania micrantha]